MLMERNAEVLRGWPQGAALDQVETIAPSTTLSNGDWVVPGSTGVVLSSAGANDRAGLVVQGNGDSGSAAYANTAVVLWGNFIVKVKNFTAGSYSAGTPLTVKSGKLAVGIDGTDRIIGYVLKVATAVAVVTTGNLEAPNDAYIIAKIN